MYLCAALSAVLLAAAAEFPSLWFLSFGALYPLICALLWNGLSQKPLGKRLLAGAFLGLFFGFLYFSFCFRWLWGLMPGLNFAVGLLQALFFVLFGLLSPFFTRRFTGCLFGLPALWTGCELLRSLGPFGFTWYGLSDIQTPNLPLLQYASLFGCRFLDYAAVFLVCAFVLFFTDRNRLHRLKALGAVVLFAAVQTAGCLYIAPVRDADKTVRLVQANMDMNKKTDTEALRKHIRLSKKGPGADLIMWPETTLSLLVPVFEHSVSEACRELGAPIVTGANVPMGENYTNSAVLFSVKGRRMGQYDKCRLVPFGEYTPFKRFFKKAPNPELAEWEAAPGSKEAAVLKTGPFKIGVCLCSEASFTEPARKQAKAGANVLAALSNDGWFGKSNAAYAHFRFARLRAVENRRWFLFCTSTGISGVVTPYGQIAARAPEGTETALDSPFGFETEKTLFTKTGDIFSPLCCLAALWLAAAGAWAGKKEKG